MKIYSDYVNYHHTPKPVSLGIALIEAALAIIGGASCAFIVSMFYLLGGGQ